MLHNPRRSFQDVREIVSPGIETRRLRLEYNRLQRRLDALNDGDAESRALWHRVERIARELASIRADSVHAVESKLKVALDLAGDRIDEVSHKLLASALSDLHYLAILSEPRTE